MSPLFPPLTAIDEVRQANQLFLSFLQARPMIAAQRFGLSATAMRLLGRATEQQLKHAAEFPRALFRLSLPTDVADTVHDPAGLAAEPELHVLRVTLLMSAWNLSRASAYSARLLLRLNEDEVSQLRHTELGDLLLLARGPEVLRSAVGDLDEVFAQLLIESRPERWRDLLLLGLQPEFGKKPAPHVV